MVKDSSKAIYRNSSWGPTFGDPSAGGCDIYMANNANSNKNSYAKLNLSYPAPNGVQDPRTILAGTYRFTPDDWEVFYLDSWSPSTKKSFIHSLIFQLEQNDDQLDLELETMPLALVQSWAWPATQVLCTSRHVLFATSFGLWTMKDYNSEFIGRHVNKLRSGSLNSSFWQK